MTVHLARPDVPFPPAELPLRAALAVSRAVDPLLPSASRIKWPNDVTFGGRKLAGLLCELRGDALLVGVGVNCGQASFPPELAGAAFSLAQLTGKKPDIAGLASAVLRELARVMTDPKWLDELRDRLDQRGRPVRVASPGSDRAVEGIVEDVGGEGELLLRLADGSLARVGQGEIRRST
jgi:BirA family biotin operon repressor/biotin-[acetyl-CoA-carboxylase] ligase